MARIVNRTLQNIDGEIRGLGFSFPMSANGVFTSTYTTRDVVKNNLINWLLTNKGERVFRPLFGANLRELIFEGINGGTLSALVTKIRENITNEFPSIEIKNIRFNNNVNEHTINFILDYVINNITEDQLTILLQQ